MSTLLSPLTLDVASSAKPPENQLLYSLSISADVYQVRSFVLHEIRSLNHETQSNKYTLSAGLHAVCSFPTNFSIKTFSVHLTKCLPIQLRVLASSYAGISMKF